MILIGLKAFDSVIGLIFLVTIWINIIGSYFVNLEKGVTYNNI